MGACASRESLKVAGTRRVPSAGFKTSASSTYEPLTAYVTQLLFSYLSSKAAMIEAD